MLESCSSPLGHTSDAGPGPDWSWLKNESINQLAITQPKSPSSERLQNNQKSFYYRLSFQTSVELICIHALRWHDGWLQEMQDFTVIFKKVSKTLIFPKCSLSFFELCRILRTRHENSRLGFPSADNSLQKLLSRSVWSLITVLICSPQHQQPPPPASLTIEQLASEQHLLLLGRCCCWPVAAQCCCCGWDVVVCCWTSLQWLARAGTRYITSHQSLSTAHLAGRWSKPVYSYLLNAWAMAGRFNVSFDIIFKFKSYTHLSIK